MSDTDAICVAGEKYRELVVIAMEKAAAADAARIAHEEADAEYLRARNAANDARLELEAAVYAVFSPKK